jgi:hypothetical protein
MAEEKFQNYPVLEDELQKCPLSEDYGTDLTKVPNVLLTVWLLVIGYSLICSYLFDLKWYLMIMYYLIGMLAFYAWHWQAHHKMWFNKACFEHHRKHHFFYYPPTDFYGDKYAAMWKTDKYGLLKNGNLWNRVRHLLPGYTSIAHEALLYVFGVSIVWISYMVGVKTEGLCCITVGYILMGGIANFLHFSFHVKGHWLEAYSWFHELRSLHFIHHVGNAKHNYAIINFSLDKILHSYFISKPSMEEKMHLDKSIISYVIRLVVILACLAGWYESQSFISSRPFKVNKVIYDNIHGMTEGINDYLSENQNLTDNLILISSFIVDFFGIWIIVTSIVGKTFRPFVSLLIVMIMRQLCQLMIQLPAPESMIWRSPGTDSIFVTYDVSNDFFFSGHTALCIVAAIELFRMSPNNLPSRIFIFFLALCFCVFEIGIILVLHSHWSIDVFAAIIAARYATMISKRYSNAIDTAFP